ncbi:hypothetical protein ACQ4PT_062334 [Festuca glaucescens]
MAMAMSCMRALVISIIFLASIRLPMVTAAVSEEAPPGGYQFELIHVDAHGNFTREELIHRALNRAHLRAAMLSAAEDKDKDVDTNSAAVSGSFSVQVQYSPKTYMMELKLGSTVPETTMMAVADTGSDLIWTNQLKECIGNPSFTPTNVSCAKACGDVGKQCTTCMFNKTYGGGNITGFTGTGTVAMTTGADTTKKKEVALAMACAIDWTQKMLPPAAQGIVGLSRGPMSLVKQLGVTEFSYCLSDPLNSSMRSPLWFGGNAQSAAGGKKGWRSTPLVEISPERSRVPEWAKNDYYVELDQICINGKCSGQLQQQDFRLRPSHGDKGLMLVDSGNTYMHLDPKIFEALKSVMLEALGVKVVTKVITKGKGKSEMNCFDETPTGKPDLVLKFPKADMSIPWASYVEKGEHGFCLYILQGMSLLGNFQQHNVSMLYDLKEKELSFKRVHDCSSLVQKKNDCSSTTL